MPKKEIGHTRRRFFASPLPALPKCPKSQQPPLYYVTTLLDGTELQEGHAWT